MERSRIARIVAVLGFASTLSCQVTMADLQASNPHAARLEVPCRPGMIPERVKLLAVQSGSGHLVTDEQPDELRDVAPFARVFIEFKDGAPDENARVMESRYGLSCPVELRRSQATPPDPRYMGQTVASSGGAGTSSLPRIGVCARPPGIGMTVNEWVGGDIGVIGATTTRDKKDYAERATKASVKFYFDANAPPESVWNFGPDTKVRCPGKKEPMPFDQYMASRNAAGSRQGGSTGTSTSTSATTPATTPKKGDEKTTSTSSPNGQGPPLETWEKFLQDFVIGTEILSGDVSGKLDDPEGARYGVPAGKKAGGFSFPPLQVGYALVKVLSTVGMTPKSFVDDIVRFAKNGQRCVIKEADEKLLKMADDLIAQHGRYEMAEGLRKMGVIMPYALAEKFTAKLGAKFQAHKIFEKRAINLLPKGTDIGKLPAVILTEAEHQAITSALAKRSTPPPENLMKLREIYRDIYKDHPHWLEAIEPYFH